MEQRILGRTGLKVSVLGLGGLFVSQVGAPDRRLAVQAVHRALELGVNYVDTAPGYHDSEEVLGLALADITRPLVLSTKLGGRPQPFDPRDADALRHSFEESLRLLGRDRVDILMVHEPDRPGQYDWWTDWEHFTGPVTSVLEELRSQGLIGALGLGGTTPYILARICATGQFDVVLTAFNYSLLWREAEIAVIPEARRQNMGIVIGSPLQQGWLARRFDAEVEAWPAWLAPQRRRQFKALYALCDELQMPITDLAIRWVISNPDITTTLMGARSVEEVEMNVAAVEAGPLPAEVLARLDEIHAICPLRPFSEPFGCGFRPGYRGPGPA